MAELPSSWGLTTKQVDGKAEVWGRNDIGQDYRVRKCDAAEITSQDVAEIAAVDRERTTSKEFVDGVLSHGARLRESQESSFMDELTEAAGPVVHAGMERRGTSVGYSRAYSRKWDRAFNGDMT